MQTLEQNNMTMRQCKSPKKLSTPRENTDVLEFPSARYFQVHFQYMESQLTLMQRTLDAINQQISELKPYINNSNEPCDSSVIKK